MSRDDFNRDLDTYIQRKRSSDNPFYKAVEKIRNKVTKEPTPYRDERPRKESRLTSSIFRRRIPSEAEVEREVGKMDPKDKKELEEIEGEVEDIEEVEEELEQEREGLMSRFFSIFKGKKDYVDEEDVVEAEEEQNTIEELKETVKIMHRWLEKLPPEQLDAFKRSPDFERYKDALRKLGLIRQ